MSLPALSSRYTPFTLSCFSAELSPPEDRGAFFVSVSGPEGAGYDYTVEQMQGLEEILFKYTGEGQPIDRVNTAVPGGWGAGGTMHTGRAIVLLKPWDQRDTDTSQLVEKVRGELNQLPGVVARPQVRTGLVRSGGQPLQVVLGGPDYVELAEWRDRMLARMEQNPGLYGADSDYKETQPQLRVVTRAEVVGATSDTPAAGVVLDAGSIAPLHKACVDRSLMHCPHLKGVIALKL